MGVVGIGKCPICKEYSHELVLVGNDWICKKHVFKEDRMTIERVKKHPVNGECDICSQMVPVMTMKINSETMKICNTCIEDIQESLR